MASTYADASASLPETVDGSLICATAAYRLQERPSTAIWIIADGVSW
ncbi:MAG: hypothetical protein ACLR4Z_13850 [Butyricicoccaceae bacterium]